MGIYNTERDPLKRFLDQHTLNYDLAVRELRAGVTTPGWLRYVFPKLRGQGESRRDYIYGLKDFEEAKDWLLHPILGPRMAECCELLLAHRGKQVEDIFDETEVPDLHASFTLFAVAGGRDCIFDGLLECFFQNIPHRDTVERLQDCKCFIIVNGVLIKCVGNKGNVVIPDGVRKIGGNAFSGYKNLECVTLPDGLKNIGRYAFYGCEKLRYVHIPKTVNRFGMASFKGCKSLADKDGFVVVNHMLHDYCGDAEEITIPKGVYTIGFEAFRGNKKLESVTLPESVSAISASAFADCPNLTLRGPAGGLAETYADEKMIPFIAE